jgi:hypothetical protein
LSSPDTPVDEPAVSPAKKPRKTYERRKQTRNGNARKGKEEAYSRAIGTRWTTPAVSDAEIIETIQVDLPVIHTHYYKNIKQWASIRALEPNLTNKQIAERLGITPNALSCMIYKATKRGWLRFDEPLDRMKYEIVPNVVDNLAKFVNEGDKQTTLEVAKGTIFKTYQAAEGIQDQQNTILAIKFESEPESGATIVTGQVVGKPKEIE